MNESRKTRVLVGVSGGIAAYKAVELVRLLRKEDFSVRVVMTPSATRFVTPLTFQAVSGKRVVSDAWRPQSADGMDHIRLAQEADLIVIAPASANIIGRMAHGIADDLLSTCFLAASCPILLAPAMNVKMFEHPLVTRNLELLKSLGVYVIGPNAGQMACGDVGFGRMSEPDEIVSAIKAVLQSVQENIPRDLTGFRVLITAGPTRERLDPVRYLTNHSSGKMGFALAEAASARGAETILVTGPTELKDPLKVRSIRVESAHEMYEQVMAFAPEMDLAVMAAAVGDFSFSNVHAEKLKKSRAPRSLKIQENRDILASLGKLRETQQNKPRVLVGFSMETEELVPRTLEKLKRKNVDLMVANPISDPEAGFGSENNRITLVDRRGQIDELPLAPKRLLADKILDRALSFLPSSGLEIDGQ